MISGAGRTPPIASPSTNWLSVSQWWTSTELSCRNGITVNAPPNVSSPAFRPSQKIVAVSETVTAPATKTTTASGVIASECVRRSHRSRVCPELVDQPRAEQDQHEARVGDQRDRERGDRDHRERHIGDERPAQANQRPRDDRPDRRGQPVEELVEVPGQVRLDVEDRQRQHQHEAGQHEPEPREEAAEPAAPEAAEIDAELVRLGAGEDLVDGERLLERLLGRPSPPRRRTRA